ncbi:hypothetical protein V5799_002750, partial [Amblyomma americanum]
SPRLHKLYCSNASLAYICVNRLAEEEDTEVPAGASLCRPPVMGIKNSSGGHLSPSAS